MNLLSFKLEGDLLFDTIKSYQTTFSAALKANQQTPFSVDLSGVNRCDSAGLAFLIDMVCHFKQHGNQYEFEGLSSNLLSLAKFYEVDNLLTEPA